MDADSSGVLNVIDALEYHHAVLAAHMALREGKSLAEVEAAAEALRRANPTHALLKHLEFKAARLKATAGRVSDSLPGKGGPTNRTIN